MQPFRNILFAADFSENSKEAFRMVCSLAGETTTRLTVLHVVEPNLVAEEPVYFGQARVQYYDAGRDQAVLDSLQAELREVYAPNRPLDVQYVVREGEPADEVLRMAAEAESDLIAMGTHGRTGLRWLLAGSVATAVMRKAQCPLLAFRNPEVIHERGEVRTILHPTDFSAGSEPSLDVARSLARGFGARLILVHVMPLELISSETMTGPVDPLAFKNALDELQKRVDGPDLKYPVETELTRGYAGDEIVRVAKERSCDLIVMGTHGRTGLGRLLMGSVAEFVLPRASCGVLAVKGAAPRRRRRTPSRPAAKAATAV